LDGVFILLATKRCSTDGCEESVPAYHSASDVVSLRLDDDFADRVRREVEKLREKKRHVIIAPVFLFVHSTARLRSRHCLLPRALVAELERARRSWVDSDATDHAAASASTLVSGLSNSAAAASNGSTSSPTTPPPASFDVSVSNSETRTRGGLSVSSKPLPTGTGAGTGTGEEKSASKGTFARWIERIVANLSVLVWWLLV
jgi:hypothetical protein